jgi:uncharacterized protein YcfJ
MFRIALTAAALGLTACASSSPYGGQTVSAQDVNCGAGVLGGAVLGGLAGNQIGGGTGQDVATAAGATIGGLLGATRRECQPQAYGQPVYRQPTYAQPVYGQPASGRPVFIGYDAYGRPLYRG